MILGLAGNLLKSLGGKKKKISGEKMAQNVMNDSKEKESVAKSSPSGKNSDVKGADLTPLEDIRDDMKASSKKSKDPLNLALDGIDNSLFGIIDTLTKTNLLRKKGRILFLKQEQQKKKTLRERMLEASSGFVKGAVGTVKGLTGSAWDKLMNFLTWTLLGAVVNYIMKNWKSVREQIEKVMEQLREVFERLQPYLLVIKDIVMWFGTTALGLINQIDKRILEEDTEKKIKEIEKQLNDAELDEKEFIGTSKQLEDFKKEIEDAGNDKEKVQKIIAEYEPLFEIEKQSNFLNPLTEEGKKGKLNEEGEPERLDDTFSSINDEVIINNKPTGKNAIELAREEYYVDQNGNVRRKSDNKKDRFGFFISHEALGVDPKLLEILDYNKDANQSNNTLLDKDVSSYTVGLEAYSEDFDTESSIILLSEESQTGMSNFNNTYFNSDINLYDSKLNIKDAFLFEKLNK